MRCLGDTLVVGVVGGNVDGNVGGLVRRGIYRRVRAFFGYSKDKQDRLIKLTEATSDAHTEETPKDIEGTELVETWDLNAATEDAPTECLS
jgi:hypothetical protein